MMERAVAVEVMRHSVQENRPDGSPSPSVGAVLVRPDGSVETAARGELRDGNHAEYILLERKCVNERLDGSVLFTTLEPCLDRHSPKRGCARHIVSARIKNVYVGILDDNPAVSGKGVEHLRRHGVTIHMFDRELQEVILEENEKFLEWARRQPQTPVEEPITLSRFEGPLPQVLFEDLSRDALDRYRSAMRIGESVESASFIRVLQQQGVLVGDGDAVRPSGFGHILFGTQPRNSVHQAGLLARADLPDGSSARNEFGGPLVLIPGALEEWLLSVLPSTIDRSSMERRERVDLPFEMIREAVVNALVHRDYDLETMKCQLVVNADTIAVKSPGGPPAPTTMEQLQSFSAPANSRNPLLHFVAARMGLAEEQAFGLERSLKRQSVKRGLPLPTFTRDGEYLVLTMFRSPESVTRVLSEEVLAKLNSDERSAWEFLATKGGAAAVDVAGHLGFEERKTQRVLKKLIGVGLIRRVGKGPATRYEVAR